MANKTGILAFHFPTPSFLALYPRELFSNSSTHLFGQVTVILDRQKQRLFWTGTIFEKMCNTSILAKALHVSLLRLGADPADFSIGSANLFQKKASGTWHSHTVRWTVSGKIRGHMLGRHPKICPCSSPFSASFLTSYRNNTLSCILVCLHKCMSLSYEESIHCPEELMLQYRVSKNVLYPKIQNFKNFYCNKDNRIWCFDLFKWWGSTVGFL